MEAGGNDRELMLAERVRVPEHVVYRDFGDETVILNLEAGTYHGLNPTAAAMLSVLGESDTVAAAVDRLAAEFGEDRARVERDVVDLCRALTERKLIERNAGGG
jgi:hypothetical protein